MSSLDQLAATQRRELLARERVTQRELVRIYGETFRRVSGELRDIVSTLAAYRAAGKGPAETAHLLAREARLERFLALARIELGRFVLSAEPLLTQLQRDHAQSAIGNTHALTDHALGPRPDGVGWEFTPPPAQVVHRLVGNAGDGTPLGDVLREVGGAQLKQVRDELLVGVARGKNPREIGRQMARALNTTATRTTVIARQESLRAYREVTTATMKANPSVITGWVWSGAGDMRECPMCIAMEGEWFSPDKTLDSHISCRCCQVPETRSWSDLGFPGVPDNRPTVRTGDEVFGSFTPAQQRVVLGPGKYEAYKSGKIALKDLVAHTHSERWGPGRRERTLREVRTIRAPAKVAPSPRVDAPLGSQASIKAGASNVLGPHNVKLDRLEVAPTKRGVRAIGGRIGDELAIRISPTVGKSPALAQAVANTERALWTERRAAEIAKLERRAAEGERMAAIANPRLDQLRATSRGRVWHDAQDPLRSLTAHEASHVLEAAYGDELRAVWESASRSIPYLDRLRVSEYAATNSSELLAETTAAIDAGLAIPASVRAAYNQTVRELLQSRRFVAA